MFPVIFTLTLERSSASTDATSGFLCMSIIGGAIIPLIVGKIEDMSGYAAGLAVPMVCYVILFVIGIAAGRARTHAAGADGGDRKSAVEGERVSVRGDLDGGRSIKKTKYIEQ